MKWLVSVFPRRFSFKISIIISIQDGREWASQGVKQRMHAIKDIDGDLYVTLSQEPDGTYESDYYADVYTMLAARKCNSQNLETQTQNDSAK